MPLTPVPGRLRQMNRYEFEANISYKVSPLSLCAREKSCLTEKENQINNKPKSNTSKVSNAYWGE